MYPWIASEPTNNINLSAYQPRWVQSRCSDLSVCQPIRPPASLPVRIKQYRLTRAPYFTSYIILIIPESQSWPVSQSDRSSAFFSQIEPLYPPLSFLQVPHYTTPSLSFPPRQPQKLTTRGGGSQDAKTPRAKWWRPQPGYDPCMYVVGILVRYPAHTMPCMQY